MGLNKVSGLQNRDKEMKNMRENEFIKRKCYIRPIKLVNIGKHLVCGNEYEQSQILVLQKE